MFKFKLQPLLDYRKSIEETALLEFADKMRRLENEKEILEGLKRERLALIGQLIKLPGRRLPAADISLYHSYISHIKDMQGSQKGVIGEAAREAEDKRTELLETVKKRKAIEILKQKKLEEYQADIINKERKELDEVGILRFVKRARIEEINNSL